MVHETHLYDILGVPTTASVEVIAKSYKKLALKYHPDKSSDPALTEKFKDVARAYEVLSDQKQRRIYDAYGTDGLDGTLLARNEAQEVPQRKPSSARAAGFGFQQAMFSQFFSNMDSMFESGMPFESGFGQLFPFGVNFTNGTFSGPEQVVKNVLAAPCDPAASAPRKGEHIHHNFKVTLADMYHGKTAKFQLPKMTKCAVCDGQGCFNPHTCATCKGSGKVIITMSSQFSKLQQLCLCSTCNGLGVFISKGDKCGSCDMGYVMKKQILTVHVLPGSKNGDKCVLKGQADEGKNIIPGDVVIHLEETPHPYLVRRDDNLYMEHDIDLKTALLGGSVVISDFPGTGEDLIVYINAQGHATFNDSRHKQINEGEIVGAIDLNSPKIVKGLGMPKNDYIKNRIYYQNEGEFPPMDSTQYSRGDLYIRFNVKIPQLSASLEDLQLLQRILPGNTIQESFGSIANEHHLSNLPGDSVKPQKQGSEAMSSDDFDYDEIDVDSLSGTEEHEDDHFYAEEWSKKPGGKRRKV